MSKKIVRITHLPSNTVLAEGPLGWGIMPFEGNLYIRRKYLLTDGFKTTFLPGLCIYKFLYVWLDFEFGEGEKSRMLGWSTGFPTRSSRSSGPGLAAPTPS